MSYGYGSPFNYNDIYKKFEIHHVEQAGDLIKEFYLYPNGYPAQIVFKNKDNKIHNCPDDPAIIRYAFKHDGHVKTYEYYYDEGKLFLEKKFYPNGNISSISKYGHDTHYKSEYMRELHCADGPAVIHFNRDGKPGDRDYYCVNPYSGYFVGKNLSIPDAPNAIMEYCANLRLLK